MSFSSEFDDRLRCYQNNWLGRRCITLLITVHEVNGLGKIGASRFYCYN